MIARLQVYTLLSLILQNVLTFDVRQSQIQKLLQLREVGEQTSEEQKDTNFQISSLHEAESLKNIDYIFSGYNLFYSNPFTYENTFDTAFTGRQIFDASYTRHKVSLDGRYKLPDGVTIQSKKGCKFSFDSKVFRTKEDVQKYFSTYVGINLASNLDVTPWAFTATQEFNQIQKSIEQKIYTYTISHTSCVVYQATLDVTEMPPFSASFLKALEQLPKEYIPGYYIDFFQTYGTHYLKEMLVGSRMGLIFALPPEQVQSNKGEKIQQKWKDDELEQASKITSQVIKGVIGTQILPRNQSSKAFTDLTKIAASTFQIEIGPQPSEPTQKQWLFDTELEPMPIKYSLGSITDLIQEGIGKLADIPSREKLVKNLRLGITDYCQLLSVQNERYGSCMPTSEMVKEQLEKRPVCLNFYETCDFEGQNQYICGNRNPVQNLGIQLPEVTAGSVKFYSETPVIIGTTVFTTDYDQAIVLSSFHNDFHFFEKSEQCFVNQELASSTRVRVYITEPKRCFVVLLWNYCPGYAVRYFTSVICNQFDVGDNFKASINEVGSCEVALLDIRFPMNIPLRICLFKNSKQQGQKTCFGSETAEQYFGQSFRSMIIDETEVVVHKAMPASIVVEFEEDEQESEKEKEKKKETEIQTEKDKQTGKEKEKEKVVVTDKEKDNQQTY